MLEVDGSGGQEHFYGPLGETTRTIRTIVRAHGNPVTYTTQWRYDTWNRLRELTYPDGERVTYRYNAGGLLHDFSGVKAGITYPYLRQLGTDKFEQRVYLHLGNDTESRYSYEPERRRLHTLQTETAANRKVMDNVYGYDAVSNILSLANTSPVPVPSLMGGPTTASYQYDDLYRLTQAQGLWTSPNAKERYSLALAYDSIHNLTTKTQTHDRQPGGSTGWLPQKKTRYNWSYTYPANGKPHAASQIGERAFSYDGNGNQTGWDNLTNGQRCTLVWDEENRIHTLADNWATQYYTYDGDGERVIKRGRQGETLYLNAYTVVRNGAMFSKHYFIESQRLVTKLGDMVGTAMLGNQPETAPVAGTTANAGTVPDYGAKTSAATQAMNQSLAAQGIDAAAFIAGNSGKTPPGQVNGTENNGSGNDGTTTGNVPGGGEQFLYYYHGDHLGSTGYVTDAGGEVYQHLEYFPFGETWIEEHNNTNRTPYLYTGKELDEETGLYYYGARYYDPRTSVWQSPDPILGQYMDGDVNGGVFNPRNLSLHSYSYQNPINLKDPDGRSTHVGADGDVITVFKDKDLGVYQHGNNADGGRPTEYMISKRAIKSGTSANGRNLGETATPYSFIGGDGKGLGSIDPKSTEGADFLKNEIIDADPSMIKYMTNARHGGKYDFKTRGETPAMSAKDRDKHRYRGGALTAKMDGTKVFASARDIGNISAGYVARRKGLSWGASRLGFDGYQSLKQGKFESEGATTQAAERYGYDMADKVYNK